MNKEKQNTGSVAVKTCGKCREVKGLEEFHKNKTRSDGAVMWCKVCSSAYYKDYRAANRGEILGRKKKYYAANREEISAWMKNYRAANKENIKAYRAANREYFNVKQKEYYEQRYLNDRLFKLKRNLRAHSRRVKYKFGTKSRTAQLLGCTWEQAQVHLILTALTNYGMYVEGMEYHIDHVIPLSSAKTEAEALALCHYTNLQLLTPEDNLAKSDKLNWDFNNAC